MHLRIRFDSMKMVTPTDITIFTNINVMAKNMTTSKSELGKNRKTFKVYT